MRGETEQTMRQTVGDAYTRLFYFFWSPIAFVAKILIECRSVQRSRFALWVLGASVGSWPRKVPDDQPLEIED